MIRLHPPGSSAVVTVPAEKARRLRAGGWTVVDVPAPPPQPVVEVPAVDPPPRAGRGSGRDVWADYATRVVGLEVDVGWSRNDIVAAVDGA